MMLRPRAMARFGTRHTIRAFIAAVAEKSAISVPKRILNVSNIPIPLCTNGTSSMVILGTIYQTLAGEEPFCLTSSIMCLHSEHVSSTTYSLRKPSPDRRNRSRHAIDCQLVGLASTRHSST